MDRINEHEFPICERCKIAMILTAIKNVWKCPMCGVIENRRLQ